MLLTQDSTIYGKDNEILQLKSSGAQVMANYYKEKYGCDITIVDETNGEPFTDLPKLIAQARKENSGQDMRKVYIIGFAEEHGVPITYLREKGKELVLVADSLGKVSSQGMGYVKQIAEGATDIDVYFIADARQADYVSCYNAAMIFGRDMTRRASPSSTTFVHESGTLVEKLYARKQNDNDLGDNKRIFATKLPDFLLKAVQISAFLGNHQEKQKTVVNNSKATGKQEDIDGFISRHKRSVLLIKRSEATDGKGRVSCQETPVNCYAKNKGKSFWKVIQKKDSSQKLTSENCGVEAELLRTAFMQKNNELVKRILASDGDLHGYVKVNDNVSFRWKINDNGFFSWRERCKPLMIAAITGNDEIVNFLLQIGANPKLADEARYTALHWASDVCGEAEIESSRTKIAKLLAEKFPETIGMKNLFGDTPLHLAAKGKNIDLVKYLIEKNSSAAEIGDKTGQTITDILRGDQLSEVKDFLDKHQAAQKQTGCQMH